MLSRRVAASIILPALFGIFALDRASDTAPVQHLYYLPIIYAALVFDQIGGLAAAGVAIALYHIANHTDFNKPYGELDILQIVLFITVPIVAAKLASDSRHLRRLAATDDLTGLHNLRSFEAGLIFMVGEVRRNGASMVMMALDVDHLKAINDAHGHLAGANAVRTVGQLLGIQLPAKALACRYGGDEFAIVIPDCSAGEAARIGDRLCRAVYECEPVLAGQAMPSGTLSISAGIADIDLSGRLQCSLEDATDEGIAEGLFRAADQALYCAKESGRNRVCR